jgi:hypothetical protein
MTSSQNAPWWRQRPVRVRRDASYAERPVTARIVGPIKDPSGGSESGPVRSSARLGIDPCLGMDLLGTLQRPQAVLDPAEETGRGRQQVQILLLRRG